VIAIRNSSAHAELAADQGRGAPRHCGSV